MSLWNMFDWIGNRVGQNTDDDELLANILDTSELSPDNPIKRAKSREYETYGPKTSEEVTGELTSEAEDIEGMRDEGSLKWAQKNRLNRDLRREARKAGLDLGEDTDALLRGPIGKAWQALTKGREKLGGESVLGTMTKFGQGDSTEGGPAGQSEALKLLKKLQES